MLPSRPPTHLAALQALSTCTVANAIETFGARLRNEGFTNRTVHALTTCTQPVVGYAATVRIRCSNPRKDGHAYIDRTDWWNELLTIPAPRIVVIQDMDEAPGTGSFIGEVHATILQRLGCAGVLTNGTIRDLPEIQRLGLAMFASGVAVSHAYAHIVDFGTPVTIAGLAIKPGDLLHGDLHGIVSVPPELATAIPAAAATILERERRVIELCSSADFSLGKLRAAVGGVFD